MHGAYEWYPRCLQAVNTVLGRHLHRDWRTGAALHPVLPMNKAIKRKR